MSVDAINEAERTRASHAARGKPMQGRPLLSELIGSGAFMAAALALLLTSTQEVGFSLATAALFILAIALAEHVRFDVGSGFTAPFQVIFVPMLFALPAGAVPLLFAVGLTLGMLPGVLRGEVSPGWLLTGASNSWFAIGPVLVLSAFHVHSPVGHWEVLGLAMAAQLAFDFLASVMHDVLCGALRFGELLREVRAIYAMDVALSSLGLTVAYSAARTNNYLAVLLVVPLFGVLRFFSSERRARLAQLSELNDAYQGTALLLGDVVEADDAYTGQHCKSVVRLALEVAEELGLDADRKRNVEFGALLHDVGKIAVPKEIINKPGALDEREWNIIKTHTIEGQRMLETIGGFMSEIGRIVRASHERWDGSGYPDQLSGEAIPLESRIVTACDAFNAMTTNRSYRPAMSYEDACTELTRCAGSHFDPSIVEALLEIAEPVAPELTGAEERAGVLVGSGREVSVVVGVAAPFTPAGASAAYTHAVPPSAGSLRPRSS